MGAHEVTGLHAVDDFRRVFHVIVQSHGQPDYCNYNGASLRILYKAPIDFGPIEDLGFPVREISERDVYAP